MTKRKWRLFTCSATVTPNMSMLYLVCVFLTVCPSCILLTGANDVYLLDKTNGQSRRFDGIGGLSGGGATSKLLVNYPKEQRDQILDYLFKPLYGASLNILKVEIGGDAQSTDGTESSHMHNAWEENYNRGYEWWLMKEAKKRNPDIRLYCLPWAFPAWVGDGKRSPYTNLQKTADYVVKYIVGAQKYHNLTMNYVGIWNERMYDPEYIKVLRKTLNDNGFTDIQIVAADGLWEPISTDIYLDKTLAEAVDIIGVHYPGTEGNKHAEATGKALWSSEDYSTFNDNVGAGCWARILNQNFVNGNMTSTISWNLIASYYEALPFKRDGLMTADSPWSGFYRVETPIWITAHTTWFVWPGMFYFPHGSGTYKLQKGGSVVSFSTADNIQLTIVIETMSHDHSICVRPALPAYTVEPQNVTLDLHGGYSWVTEVDVWYSKLMFNGEPSTLLKKMPSLPVVNGTISISLGVDEVYTLTTLQKDDKPDYPPVPQEKPFPLPYQDNFESYMESEEPYNLAQQVGVFEIMKTSAPHGHVIQQKVLELPCAWCDADKVNNSLNLIAYTVSQEPYNFAPQVGVFEVQPTRDSHHQQVMTQVVLENPLYWCLFIDLVFPFGVIGNSNWTDIYVEADTFIGSVNASSGVYVAARVDNGGCNSFMAEGFFFFLFPDMGTIELTGDLARTKKIYQKQVKVSPFWNTLALLVHNNYVAGTVNGDQVFNISMPEKSSVKGWVALGSADYGLAEFDNLKIMESADGLRRMKTHQQGPLSEKWANGPTFDQKPKILDQNLFHNSNKFTQDKDDTLYFRPLRNGKDKK